MSKEKELENKILELLSKTEGCFAWKNNSVGIYDPVKKTYRKSKNKYAINGVSDILGIYKGLFLAIEVKYGKGKPSTDQKLFVDKIEEYGGVAGVVWSIEDVQELLEYAEFIVEER